MSLKTVVPMVAFLGLLSSITILRTDYQHIACAAALPMMGLGIFIGNRIHANLNTITFNRLVAGILMVSGLPLLVR